MTGDGIWACTAVCMCDSVRAAGVVAPRPDSSRRSTQSGRCWIGGWSTCATSSAVIVLAEPVRQRLAAYLDYRARTWPSTITAHLFIHVRSAFRDRPATPWWIHKQLGMPGQLIRQDRILDEAHAASGELRMVCELFGLSAAGALRYIASVNSPDRGGAYRI